MLGGLGGEPARGACLPINETYRAGAQTEAVCTRTLSARGDYQRGAIGQPASQPARWSGPPPLSIQLDRRAREGQPEGMETLHGESTFSSWWSN